MNGNLSEIKIDSEVYYTCLTRKYLQRKVYEPADSKLLSSVIPGTVTKLCVKGGDVVKRGDLLLILEAMKMENRIVAPFDGMVKSVCVAEGDKIAKNATMIEFE